MASKVGGRAVDYAGLFGVAGLAPTNSQWRTLQAMGFARVLVAVAVLLSLVALGAPPGLVRPSAPSAPLASLLADAAIYLVLAIALAAASLYARQQFLLQIVGHLCADMVMITLLAELSGGVVHGVVILYLLPLAESSLLLPTLATFFLCAIVVIAILFDTTLRSLTGEGSELFQAGLFGAALFGISGLLRVMAVRLAGQEELAQARGRVLENQLEINRLVIAQMAQGVLVVDAACRVRANNRSARRMLGLDPEYRLTGQLLQDLAQARPLAQAFVAWLGSGSAADTPGRDPPARGIAADYILTMPELNLRARFVQPAADGTEEFVIFLEDTRQIEERAQRLKLAAMGRLTASIAHEIRNPLAAISHAGQLLGEDATEPVQKRLAEIVKENTRRLNRLVEDVLRVARREPPVGDDFDLREFVSAWVAEFERDRQVAPGRVLVVAPERAVPVKFEQAHLRQILFNLVDNALRYASQEAGAVRIVVDDDDAGGARTTLWVLDDGPGIAPDARAALFEPFFTTHARGTGLGLFLAREFCVANRADLAYDVRRRRGEAERAGFALRFGRDSVGADREPDFLDTIPAP